MSKEVIGWVYVENTLSIFHQRIAEALYQSFLITLVIVLSAIVLALWSGRQLVNTVVGLTNAVKHVRNGNLNTVVEVTDSREFGMLQSGFNAMIESMRNSQAELSAMATKQLRDALNELEDKNQDLILQREKAQQANQAKSRFLATMSHEIRTPLSGMLGMLTLIKGTQLSNTQSEYVGNLELAAKSLRALIEDILDLSRIEAGKLSIHREQFSLSMIIDEISAMLAPSAHDKNVEFIAYMAPELPGQVYGDPTRLRQVLINLVSNAIKFTDEGYITLRVLPQGDASANAPLVRFEVQDTGIGIEQSKQHDIFDSFIQVDNSNTRRYQGTGLGTAISKELVGLMQGRIGLNSEPGRGSLFWFELPLQDAGVVDEPGTTLHGLRLLLLEKNGVAREAFMDYAKVLGVSVDSVDTDAAFIDRLRHNGSAYSVVVVAENSRASENLALIRRLRNAVADGEVAPFVHMTFFNGKTDPTVFGHQLIKPVSVNGLRRLLTQVVERRDGVAVQHAHDVAAQVPLPLNVLVVEDDPINAKVLETFLHQMGHRSYLAKNGIEALAQLRQQQLDLVFMDMQMPQMDGPEATRVWRAEEPESLHIPIIALSANVTVDDRALCLAAGMDGFISKPIEQDKLQGILQQVRNSLGTGS